MAQRRVLASVMWLAAACGTAADRWWEPAPGQMCAWLPAQGADFYAGEPAFPAVGNLPGQPLRMQPVAWFSPLQLAVAARLPPSQVSHGFRLFRLVYLSQAPLGTARLVSAQLAIPDEMSPSAVLVVRGHGTTGMADHTAPSHDLGPGFQGPGNPFSFQLIAQGHPVIQPDYAGQGTHGHHPYMVLDAAAFSLLDGARAAQRLCNDAEGIQPMPHRVVLEGHSQGGHAVLGALQYQPEYAPEQNMVAAVLFAPAGEPALLAQQVANAQRTRLVTAMALTMVVYQDYYNAIDLADYFQPSRQGFATRADQWVMPALALYTSDRPAFMFTQPFLEAIRAGDTSHPLLAPLEPLQTANTPGNFTATTPILMLHGTDDDLIDHAATQALHQRLCQHANPVQWQEVEGASHTGVVAEGTATAVNWLHNQLDDPHPATDCP